MGRVILPRSYLDPGQIDSEVLEKALGLPSEERSRFVASLYRDDSDAAERMLQFLARVGDLSSFLNDSPLCTPSDPRLRVGELLDGRFEILSFAGTGGMGRVYRVLDHVTEQVLALKLCRDLQELSENQLTVLRDEIQHARSVTHPNVCRIHELFVSKHAGRPLVFFTMELLEGVTLAEHIAQSGPMPPLEVLEAVRQVAAGLDAVHNAGIVHRDLKPGNIFIVSAPNELRRFVITDFGIACRVPESVAATPGIMCQMFGTPEYMAPEQLLEAPVHPVTDVYALALITCEMVTGKRLNPQLSRLQSMLRRVAEDKPTLQEIRNAVPKGWLQPLSVALSKDPRARYSSAGEFARALQTPDRSERLKRNTRRALLQAGALAVAGFGPWWVIANRHRSSTNDDPAKRRRQAARREFDAGNLAWRAGKADDAILRFKNALAVDPSYAAAASRLADVLMANGQPDQAYQCYWQSVKLLMQQNPTDRDTLIARGRFALDIGLTEEADDVFARLLIQFPADPLGMFYRAGALAALDRVEQAEDLLTQAIRRSPANYAFVMGRARLFLETGRIDNAEADWRRGRAINPNNWTDQIAMAIAFVRRDYAGAALAVRRMRSNGSLEFQSKSFAFEACLLAEAERSERAELSLRDGIEFDRHKGLPVSHLATKKRMLCQLYLQQAGSDKKRRDLARCSCLDAIEDSPGNESRLQAACVLAMLGQVMLNPDDLCYTHAANLQGGIPCRTVTGHMEAVLAQRHCDSASLPAWPVYEYWKRRLSVELSLASGHPARALEIVPTIPEPPFRHVFPDYLIRIAHALSDRELEISTLELLRSRLGRWWMEPDRNAPGFVRYLETRPHL